MSSLLLNCFPFAATLLSGCLSQVCLLVLLWVMFFPIWQAWQLLFCGKFTHLKLPLVLCCGSAADSVEWKRRRSASQNKQKADIIAGAAASTGKWKRCLQIHQCGCGLWPAANLEPHDSWPGLALRKQGAGLPFGAIRGLGLVALLLLRLAC